MEEASDEEVAEEESVLADAEELAEEEADEVAEAANAVR